MILFFSITSVAYDFLYDIDNCIYECVCVYICYCQVVCVQLLQKIHKQLMFKFSDFVVATELVLKFLFIPMWMQTTAIYYKNIQIVFLLESLLPTPI